MFPEIVPRIRFWNACQPNPRILRRRTITQKYADFDVFIMFNFSFTVSLAPPVTAGTPDPGQKRSWTRDRAPAARGAVLNRFISGAFFCYGLRPKEVPLGCGPVHLTPVRPTPDHSNKARPRQKEDTE
jgi:hypothetical protein